MNDSRHHLQRLLDRRLFWAVLLIGVFAANVVWCSRNRLAGDVSWYLYAVQRLRNGAVLYHDIHDMNPPIVYLMYLPLGWLNSLTGLRIDWLLYGALAAASIAAVAWVWKIPGLTTTVRGVVALSIAFAGLSVNRFQLGQRDPICALLFTGLVIAAYLRLRGDKPDLACWLGVIAASFGMAMKPHFLAPWALVAAFMAWQLGLRHFIRMKEAWVPLLISTVAWSITFLAFPDFRTMVALAYRYYSNMNVTVYEFSPLMIPLAVVAFALTRKSEPAIRPLIQISALATLGFVISCLAQRKAFPYHVAPAMYWAITTTGLLVAGWARSRRGWTAAFAIALPAYSLWTATLPPPAFFAPTDVEAFVSSRAHGKTVLSLSTDLRTGFPLILEAGAVNARADAQLWMLGEMYRDQVEQSDASSEPVKARYHTRVEMDEGERERFDQVVEMVANKRPAIILVQIAKRKWGLKGLQFDFLEYFSTDARFREAVRSYKPGPSNDKCRVLVLDAAAGLIATSGVHP